MMFLERMWPEQPKFGKHNKMPQDGIATAWTLCFMCFFAWELKHHRTWDGLLGLLGLLGSTNVYQKNAHSSYFSSNRLWRRHHLKQLLLHGIINGWFSDRVPWPGAMGLDRLIFHVFFDLFGHLCPDFCHIFSMKGPWCDLNRSWTAA